MTNKTHSNLVDISTKKAMSLWHTCFSTTYMVWPNKLSCGALEINTAKESVIPKSLIEMLYFAKPNPNKQVFGNVSHYKPNDA